MRECLLTARITLGLEPALVDHFEIDIREFAESDDRLFRIRTVGPAALLTAKAMKMRERLLAADKYEHRVVNKDALDIFRILQATETETLCVGFATLEEDKHAREASKLAIDFYRSHARTSDDVIPTLASEASGDDPTVAIAFAALVTSWLDELDGAER